MPEISADLQHEIEEVVRLKDDNNMTYAQIAEVMDFSESTAKRRYKAGILLDAVKNEDSEGILAEFPEAEPLEITVTGPYLADDKQPITRFKPLLRTGDAIVAADWHIPLHKPSLVNTLIRYARENEHTKLIIPGDFFHMEEFGSFLPFQPEAGIDIERHDGNLIMKTLLQTFDEIDMIWGNHDFRLSRKMGFKYSFTECMKWMLSALTEEEMSKIRFSDLDYMLYFPQKLTPEDPGFRKFRICHPRNFSSVPLTVGRKLAQKYNCSIITAHSHHLAMGTSPNGRDIVIEAGGLYDKYRTEYIQRTTNHHEWVPGFVAFKDGIPELISPIIGNDVAYKEVK